MKGKNFSVEVTELSGLPARQSDAHKGDFGRVLIVAGSTGMAGAGALSALSALRSGAGLVTLVVPANAYVAAATFSPCVMTRPSSACPDCFTPDALDELKPMLADADILALGPGLGRDPATVRFVRELVQLASDVPLVLDADGLFALCGHLDLISRRTSTSILTPHPGELSYLTGTDISDIQTDRTAAARKLAQKTAAIAVLKGHRTVVTDGQRYYINPTGNAGMATAGSGDVLTGVIAALPAQGMNAFDAACLGTCMHGLAGDLAAETIGQPALIATDLIDHLPDAFILRAQHERS